jgi:hypothetical protein
LERSGRTIRKEADADNPAAGCAGCADNECRIQAVKMHRIEKRSGAYILRTRGILIKKTERRAEHAAFNNKK